MKLTINSTVVADDSNDDNGVCEITTTGGVAGKSIELRLTASGNPTDLKRWRILLNPSGGIEIQGMSDDYSQQWNVLSLANQRHVNANVDACGLNLDTDTGLGSFQARNADGTVPWGGVEVYNYPTTLGSQTRIQSKPMNGAKRDDIIADAGGDANNPVVLRLGGSMRRVGVDANGFLRV